MSEEKLVTTPFLDWYGVWPSHRKLEKDGTIWSQDPPAGIKLSITPARKSDVFFKKERPWEVGSNLHVNTIIYEDGIYRLWYGVSKEDGSYVCYAESKDGFDWRRPDLGLIEYEGSKRNNILSTGEKSGLGSIFVDPSAPAEERYKAIAPQGIYYRDGKPEPTMTREKFKQLLIAMDLGEVKREERSRIEVHRSVVGSVSPDGINWKHLDEPILDVGNTALDTHNICTFDPFTNKYVAYLRGGRIRRRLVRRAEGREFRKLEAPIPCLLCDPQDPVDDDVYNPCYCPYPGGTVFGRQLYLMFPSIYHRIDSTVDIQLAVSHDSYNWARPERKPIIDREHPQGEYGMVYATPNLIALENGEWRLAYEGNSLKHDFLDRGAKYGQEGHIRELRWASWGEDRLVALEAPAEARVTLITQTCIYKEMRLNFKTEKDGWIKAEVVNTPVTPPKEVKPFPGYSKEEAELLTGDELSRVVTWNGKSDLAPLKGTSISIRLHMYRAKVFSIAL